MSYIKTTSFSARMIHFSIAAKMIIVSAVFLAIQTLNTHALTPELVDSISDSNGNSFGNTVAVYESTIVVGTASSVDEIYVFDLDETGSNWQLTQTLTVTDDSNDGYALNLGQRCVDIYENIIAATAHDDRIDGNAIGSVIFWEKDNITNTWTKTTKVYVEECCVSWDFGWDFSITDEYAVFGSPDFADTFVFTRDPTTSEWSLSQQLIPSGSHGYYTAYFGFSVEISYDSRIIVIGSGGGGAAELHIFERLDASSSTWTETGFFEPPTGQPTSGYADCVTIYENIAATTGDRDNSNQGAVYIYNKNTSTGVWEEVTYVAPDDGQTNGLFGRSIKLFETTLLVSSRHGVYIYKQSVNNTSEWYLFDKLDASYDITWYNQVSMYDDYIVIGDKESNPDYVYIYSNFQPTSAPVPASTGVPSEFPTVIPTNMPSEVPTALPSKIPSVIPTIIPSILPSEVPSSLPTNLPSTVPTSQPTSMPNVAPSQQPTLLPSSEPTFVPSENPTANPIIISSSNPTGIPSAFPIDVIKTTSSGSGDVSLKDTNDSDNSYFENLTEEIIIAAIVCVSLVCMLCMTYIYLDRKRKDMKEIELARIQSVQSAQTPKSRTSSQGSIQYGNNSNNVIVQRNAQLAVEIIQRKALKSQESNADLYDTNQNEVGQQLAAHNFEHNSDEDSHSTSSNGGVTEGTGETKHTSKDVE